MEGGQPPQLRSLTEQEQREWERHYRRPPHADGDDAPRGGRVERRR
jgi:hypothetical protein